MKNNSIYKKRKHHGYSLIELVIVIGLLGTLAYMYVSGTKGADHIAKAGAMAKTVKSLNNVFVLANMSCGTGSNIETSTLSTAGTVSSTITVLLTGSGLNPTYKGCFEDSGAEPLNGSSRGSAGNEKVLTYGITAAMVGTNKIAWTYTGVQEKTALVAYRKFSSATNAATADTLPAGGDATDPYFRFSVANGLANVTFIESI